MWNGTSGRWASSQRRAQLPADWHAIRQAILQRDQGVCYICLRPGATEVDHITPVSQGGTDRVTNLAAICRKDHAIKSAREGAQAANAARPKRTRPPTPHPGLRETP